MSRDDLKAYKYNQQWIQEQLKRYEEQKAIVLNISQSIDGMPKVHNKPNYALEELLDSYNEILAILNKDQKKQNEILKQLRKVNEPYRTILTERYINGKRLEEISAIVHYSYDRTCKMHGIALNKFDDLEKWSANVGTGQ